MCLGTLKNRTCNSVSHRGSDFVAQPGTPKSHPWNGDDVNMAFPLVLWDLANYSAPGRLLMLGAFGGRSRISGGGLELLVELFS